MSPRRVTGALVLINGLSSVADAANLRPRKSLSFLAASDKEELQSHSMARLYPYYHSTDSLRNELTELSKRCPGMSLRTIEKTADNGDVRQVDVVDIKSTGDAPANKNFLLFGEHSRELISPESGLHFIQTLCGENDLKEQAQAARQDNDFEIVVNGNAASRRKVEQGDFCLRVNPDGVDLNRNWDEKWQAAAVLDPADTNPGPHAFSEPETQIFKDLVESYKPSTFLTIHSGTKGMYMPWAFDMEHLAQRNQPEMMEILKKLDKGHCQCPYGAAGKEVGYSCPGTCLDWVYDQMKADYAFAFEIYTNPALDDMLRERWEEKIQNGDGAFYQLSSHLGHSHFKDVFEDHPSSFVQVKSQKRSHMSPEECFAQFNPDSEEEFKSTVENWSQAYLEMANMVAANLRKGGSQAQAAVNATI